MSELTYLSYLVIILIYFIFLFIFYLLFLFIFFLYKTSHLLSLASVVIDYK